MKKKLSTLIGIVLLGSAQMNAQLFSTDFAITDMMTRMDFLNGPNPVDPTQTIGKNMDLDGLTYKSTTDKKSGWAAGSGSPFSDGMGIVAHSETTVPGGQSDDWTGSPMIKVPIDNPDAYRIEWIAMSSDALKKNAYEVRVIRAMYHTRARSVWKPDGSKNAAVLDTLLKYSYVVKAIAEENESWTYHSAPIPEQMRQQPGEGTDLNYHILVRSTSKDKAMLYIDHIRVAIPDQYQRKITVMGSIGGRYYSMAPEFLAQPMTYRPNISIINSGTSNFTNAKLDLVLAEDVSGEINELETRTLNIGTLKASNIYSSQMEQFNFEPSTVAKKYTLFSYATANEADFEEEKLLFTITPPLITNDIYARDNGVVGTTGFNANINATTSKNIDKEAGMLYYFREKTAIYEVMFKVFEPTATKTKLRIHQINNGVTQFIFESNEIVIKPKGAENFEANKEYTLALTTPLKLEAGEYIFTFTEEAEKNISISLTNNQLFANQIIRFYGTKWYYGSGTAYLRLRVAKPTATALDESKVNNALIYATQCQIMVKNAAQGTNVELYNISGQCITKALITNPLQSIGSYPRGIYVVKIGNTATKITVQ